LVVREAEMFGAGQQVITPDGAVGRILALAGDHVSRRMYVGDICVPASVVRSGEDWIQRLAPLADHMISVQPAEHGIRALSSVRGRGPSRAPDTMRGAITGPRSSDGSR
jgi:hypothetical protein